MKWMQERDLLIAQTLAFVQSVTGKTPDAEPTAAEPTVVEPIVAEPMVVEPMVARPTVAKPIALLKIEISEAAEPSRAAAPLPEVTPLPAETPPAARAAEEILPERSIPTPLPRLDLRDDFQAEIRARVANFRAHQERCTREREAYCNATMAKVHAVLREGEQPTQRSK
jgi:hypothetical protein